MSHLPNALTAARLVLAPVFVWLVWTGTAAALGAAFLVFVAGALTDLYDGILARRRNAVTDIGRIADPIADKVLVLAALGVLAAVRPDLVPRWMVGVIAVREVAVTVWRLARLGTRGIVVEADVWGKWKTTFQMIAILYTTALLALAAHVGDGDAAGGEAAIGRRPGGRWLLALPYAATLAATTLAVVSGIEVVAANRRRPIP
jgi:CDP-diacylglycerol--glycerol-3-phosphate 3-phosphatidyltransferase